MSLHSTLNISYITCRKQRFFSILLTSDNSIMAGECLRYKGVVNVTGFSPILRKAIKVWCGNFRQIVPSKAIHRY